MRVIDRNVNASNISGFEKVGTSQEQLHLSKDGVLRAGKTWKGRFIGLLESVGYLNIRKIREYCIGQKIELAKDNSHAAWTLWQGLTDKYGVDNAVEALQNTGKYHHGLDGIRSHYKLIRPIDKADSGILTCGEVSLLISGTKRVAAMRRQQMETLEARVPVQEHEAAYYNPEDAHTSDLSDAIVNHQRAKAFAGNRENLLEIIHNLGEDTSRLKQPRVDYVMSRMLKEVGQATRSGVYSRDQLYRMAEKALKESLQHKASWSRMQAMEMGLNKLMKEPTAFKRDMRSLSDSVNAAAKQTVTRDYVQTIGHEIGVPVKSSRAGSIAKDVVKAVEKRVKKERIELKEADFRAMVEDALRKR